MIDRAIAPSTCFTVAGASIKVSHDSFVALGATPADIVVLRQEGVTPDTLTRIEVRPDLGGSRVVLLLWERNYATDEVGILFSAERQTLFVGAGTFAAAVQLVDQRVVGEHVVDLFWGFQRTGEFVIELGELSCYLRALSGEILAQAPVDAPFEMSVSPEGARFESIVMGTTWLRFPDQE